MQAAVKSMQSTLEVAQMRLTHDEATVIAECAIRLDSLRRKSWGMPRQNGRSAAACELRKAVQRAERELDEAIDTVRSKRHMPTSITTNAQEGA